MELLNGAGLWKMVEAAVSDLESQSARINGLNVFPVPDGDTGTNMVLTLRSALSVNQGSSVGDVARGMALETLKGARGNSGTILSQFVQGFYEGVRDKQHIGPTELAQALGRAAEVAYRAVVEPQEGTMLTVGRAAADAAIRAAEGGSDIVGVLQAALAAAEETLERTPEMLPILKDAGVVDAGGEGLVVALRAALRSLVSPRDDAREFDVQSSTWGQLHDQFAIDHTEITFKYCTEFLIAGNGIDVADLKVRLAPLGDSLIVVGGPELVKVHVHTDRPGLALEIGCSRGDLLNVSVSNMQEQNRESVRAHEAASAKDAAGSNRPEASRDGAAGQPSEFGVVAVSLGPGFTEILKSFGVGEVIPASSAAKPSAGQIADAVRRLGARRVIVLPGHKDVLLAAQQAGSLSGGEVHVIPALSAPSAVAAALQFDPFQSFETNLQSMRSGIEDVRVGAVARAVRNAKVNGRSVAEGEYVALIDGEIAGSCGDLVGALGETVRALEPAIGSVVTLYFGDGVSPDDAERHAESVRQSCPDLEVQVYFGGQSVYPYFVAVE